MTLREGGEGGPALSVTMPLIFPKIVWTCPLRKNNLKKTLNLIPAKYSKPPKC